MYVCYSFNSNFLNNALFFVAKDHGVTFFSKIFKL